MAFHQEQTSADVSAMADRSRRGRHSKMQPSRVRDGNAVWDCDDYAAAARWIEFEESQHSGVAHRR